MLNSAQRSKLREAILESIPSEPSQYDQVDAKYVYLPHSHVRALDTNAMLVTGIRGAGKSFWWNALLDPRLRQTLLGRAGTESVDVKTTAGFGLQPGSDRPDKDEIASLLPLASPRIIWKTIVLRQLAGDVVPRTSWRHSVKWVVTHPSEVAAALRTEDSALAKKGQRHVVLFDALDRTADTPSERLDLLKGLLELVLEFRSFAALRAKVFVRPDMLDDPRTRAFPDASKVVASRVSLDWSGLDLYGLLFKYIANSGSLDGASTFRRLTEAAWVQSDKSSFDVPREIRGKAVAQEKVFVQLAGPWMGRNERRGKTYTWVPNHLADALGNVSPRSFLAAIRRAADIAELGDQVHPLHWTGLQEGVRKASEYRVLEVAEDLPFAHKAMERLVDIVVPCEKRILLAQWSASKLEVGSEQILEQLRTAGILKVLPDGRVNIPDVYRVGFGLRRKGGFAPD